MTLSLPFMCMIPDNVQYDDRLSDSCKLYFGQIFPLTTRCGYLWATDRQLAEMKGCSIRTIERFNTELERLGYIRREVQNFPIKNENGEWSFEKRRKIYILSGVFNTHTFLEPRTVENTPKVDQPQQMAVPKEIFEKKEKNSEN